MFIRKIADFRSGKAGQDPRKPTKMYVSPVWAKCPDAKKFRLARMSGSRHIDRAERPKCPDSDTYLRKKSQYFLKIFSKRLQNFKYGSNNGTQSSPWSSASAASASRSALLLMFTSRSIPRDRKNHVYCDGEYYWTWFTLHPLVRARVISGCKCITWQ